MFEAFTEGLAIVFSLRILCLIFAGVLIGLIVGIIPGIGGLVGAALFLPFIFGMSPDVAFAFLTAFVSVTYTGGSITAILLNVPGTGTNAATLIDGFPMNQKGEGGRAIGAAVTASMMGGVAAVPLALVMMPMMKPILMNFRSPEMAALVIFGVTVIGTLGTGSMIKGVLSGLLGLLLSLVGHQIMTATDRFTFGTTFLYGGLGIVAVTLGLFGVAELFDMIAKGRTTIAREAGRVGISGALQGVKDVWVHWWIWLRSTVIGYICGFVPGVGGGTASFVAYGQARQTSRNPEKFGTGCVEGVIAPESANNAKEGGALLTTMAFGIPGSPVMAIFLAGFLLVGVTPGPRMLTEHLSLAYALLIAIAVANVMGGIICLLTASYMSKVAFVHMDFLFPILIVVMFGGAFVASRSLLNFAVVVSFALLGLAMKRWGYSRPAFMLGFILGNLFEYYTLMSYKLKGVLFFTTPICLTMFAIMISLFMLPYIRKRVIRKKARPPI